MGNRDQILKANLQSKGPYDLEAVKRNNNSSYYSVLIVILPNYLILSL